MSYFVIKIYNNSVSYFDKVSSEEEGLETIYNMARDLLGRDLKCEEKYLLDNNLEIYNEEDIDNMWCICLIPYE